MPYDNHRRQQSARATRSRILHAAHASFLRNGFGGTTIRKVADEAGVSQETIYKSFGGKAALLKSVYDVALAGDDEAVPLAGRPEVRAARDATDPAAAATAYAELAQLISSRIDPLLRVLLGSRDTDPSLAEFARTTEQERLVGSGLYVRHWKQAGWVRGDLSVEEATEALWALNSPQPRWLLLDHGWSEERYTRWLAELVHRAVFEEQPTA